jgi:hypothetical protein
LEKHSGERSKYGDPYHWSAIKHLIKDSILRPIMSPGAIGGYVITLLKMPSLLQDNLLMVILLAVPIVILFVMAKAGKL